jgi:hypothetical protein
MQQFFQFFHSSTAALLPGQLLGTFDPSSHSSCTPSPLSLKAQASSSHLFFTWHQLPAYKPLAFIEEDFTFYTLSKEAILADPTRAAILHVRYRYDKSNSRRHGSHICAIKAAMSIFRRHRMLGRSKDLPLGAFMNKQWKICTILGKHMEKSMRLGCERAYPNKDHYLRQHIKRLMSHSIRVFACVARKNAGVSEEDIVYRLRWNSDAVRFYTRDCYRLSDTLTGQALLGAFHNEWTSEALPSTPSLYKPPNLTNSSTHQ